MGDPLPFSWGRVGDGGRSGARNDSVTIWCLFKGTLKVFLFCFVFCKKEREEGREGGREEGRKEGPQNHVN